MGAPQLILRKCQYPETLELGSIQSAGSAIAVTNKDKEAKSLPDPQSPVKLSKSEAGQGRCFRVFGGEVVVLECERLW